MWNQFVKILWIVVVVGSVFTKGDRSQKQVASELMDRLDIVEELLGSQIESQEVLRVSLRKETDRRRTLETLLMRSLEEEKVKLEELTSILKVTSDRVEALDQTMQDEIKLREEAEIIGKEAILQLSTKVNLVERDLGLLSLLNSRLRELEGHNGVQNEEIFNLQITVSQIRKSVSRERREIQQIQSAIEPLVSVTSQHSSTLTGYDHRIHKLSSWLISHNESAIQESELLQEVKTNVYQLTANLTDIQDSIANLTESVTYLHEVTPTTLLKLCPAGYRKVGNDCLQFIETRTSWEDARLKCEELGIIAGGIGELTIPTSIPEFRAYVAKLEVDSYYLWVGAKRDDDDVWRWVSGLSLEEQEVPWDLGEPDNYDNQFHLCVRATGNIKFHDCLVDAQLSSICQLS